jgi:hypothetical protein
MLNDLFESLMMGAFDGDNDADTPVGWIVDVTWRNPQHQEPQQQTVGS